MHISLENQTIVITGGAKRLGHGIALECAQAGANVAITYLSSHDEAQQTIEQLQAIAPMAKFAAYQLEVSEAQAVREFQQRVVADFRRVHGLVNNAAIFKRTPFAELDETSFDEHIDANLKGPFLLSKAFADHFMEHGSGAIVNFADIYAIRPLANFSPYCLSKAGIVTLTETFAKALAPIVRVNCVCPGTILPLENQDNTDEELLKRIPFKRFGHVEEIAQTVVFLLGGPQFITGAILPVDGGQRLR